MTNWCESCLYEEYDGAEEPCTDCVRDTEVEGNAKPTEYFPKKPPKPVTRGDKLRAMTDEELADWFYRIQYDVSDYYCGGHSCEPTLPARKESWLVWLKQEAKE